MTSINSREPKQTLLPKDEKSKPLDPSILREKARKVMEKPLPPLLKHIKRLR